MGSLVNGIYLRSAIGSDMDKLEGYLSQFKTETIAVAFHDLETGREFLYRADEPLYPASTFKVAVMMAVYDRAQSGLLSLDEPLRVVNSFPSLADGSRFSLQAEEDGDAALYRHLGQDVTIRRLVRLMIVRSSNLATNLLLQKVPPGDVTVCLDELGIEGIQILRGVEDKKAHALGWNNSATARGLMQMMKGIAEGRAVSRTASEEMIRILLEQEYNEGIPAGLPPQVKTAHKTGWIDTCYHDFGIVFPPGRKPYVLAVMTRDFASETDAHACVAQISHRIYGSFSY